MTQYRVYIEENARYRLPNERRLQGIYYSGEEAEQACRMLIDNFLLRSYAEDLSAKELFQQYSLFGEDAFIVAARDDFSFSARQYARTRCHQLCGAGMPVKQELTMAI